MAVDSRIQTTITAGRAGKEAPYDFNQGPVMIILLSCLAVAMCFTTLGMGFVNIASGMAARKAGNIQAMPVVRKPSPLAPPVDIEASVAKSNKLLETQIAKLESDSASVDKERQTLIQQLEAEKQEMSAQQENAVKTKQRIDELLAQKAQISATITDLQNKIAGNSAEARRRLQLRAQLEQQKGDASRQIAETERRIQELQRAIEDKRNTFDATSAGGGPTSFVECTKDGIVVLGKGQKFTLQDLGNPGSFVSIVGKRSVQFLIRPDGFQSFRAARNAAEMNGITVGYEPIDANWRLKYH